MSKQEKLLEKLADPAQDANWNFGDMIGLLQRLGWEMRVRGSHHFFRKRPFVIVSISNRRAQKRKAIKFAR